MSMLEVRLLGGFEVTFQGRPAAGFESKKARALLAFLILNAGQRDFTRDQLATMLWPDSDEETARRNLRQALYNLRQTIETGTPTAAGPYILTSQQTVRFNRESDYWLDVDAFWSSLNVGRSEAACVDAHALAEASGIYRGDLLAGLLVEAGEELEQWLLVEQERLREAALEALRLLVRYHTERGELTSAIAFARRHLEVDPLSEEAHRDLMRLYALSGRRSRALAQYESCVNMLRMELSVRPVAETAALYEAILSEEVEAQGLAREIRPSSPTVPLVGRREPYARLRASWARSLAEGPRLALVVGEGGVGKTRLVKAFIHDLSARRRVRVMLARCQPGPLPICFAPLADTARSLLGALDQDCPQWRQRASPEALVTLLTLAPDLSGLLGGAVPSPRGWAPTAPKIAHALVDLLATLRCPSTPGQEAELILFFDDLQWADPASREVLRELLEECQLRGAWVVATVERDELATGHVEQGILAGDELAARVDLVSVHRLEPAQVSELAHSVVDGAHASEVAALLAERTGGLPLAAVEWINLLCDEGVLVERSDGRWTLSRPPGTALDPHVVSLADVVRRRIEQLPESARRFLALAAVMGTTFEAELVQRAAKEHVAVVEIALELLLQRCLVRHSPHHWFDSRRERDLVLWSQGARRGAFEFANTVIRCLVSEGTPLERRQHMHRQIAEALEQSIQSNPERRCEELAAHFLAGEAWDRALPCLELAAKKALRLRVPAVAQTCYVQAGEVLDRLIGSAGTREEKTRWRRERRRVDGILRRWSRDPAPEVGKKAG